MPPARARTTITLPTELLTALDQAIRDGMARSRNEFLVSAVRSQLAECRRAKIDAAFEAMATDPEYQQEAAEIAEEFAASDWEAFQHAERRS